MNPTPRQIIAEANNENTGAPSGSAMYSYRLSRELEGTFPRDSGAYIISAMRVAFGWGNPPDSAWANSSLNAPIPPEVEIAARAYRAQLYYRVESLNDAKRVMAFEDPCLPGVAFPVTSDWFDAPQGRVPLPLPDAQVFGTHSVTLTEYSDADQRVTFVNSWGALWGDRGYGSLPYEFFDRNLQEGWTITGIFSGDSGKATKLLNWGYRCALGVIHGIEIYDSSTDERRAWALILERQGYLEVQDLFVKPEFRRRGCAARLAHEIRSMQSQLKLPLIAQISPLDARMSTKSIARLVGRLNLQVSSSEKQWATYVATSRDIGTYLTAQDIIGERANRSS